ncbi:zinc-ribbon domain-containing protein [Bacillus altitudinis]|uniref:zinc-ribbon domain-containing protein n=1 Tax=Bacillus altitudinis TaxID=293387 RepID=UPI002D799B22|nr:zinc-ribbon domain-containing protein [Bacillus altitudinis]WRO25161.1 zinc-ribbon domain-containing protein [Bacillus altitudinis]
MGSRYLAISSEWNYQKNIGTQFDYPYGSQYKAHWKCQFGHEWTAVIGIRTVAGTECPQCLSSKGEKIIADYLTKNDIEFETQYRVIIGKTMRFYDFYISDFKLFVEIHGRQHYLDERFGKGEYFTPLKKQQKIDKEKQNYAEINGHYLCVDYREHRPELALERFEKQFDEFLDKVIDGTINF